MSTELVLCVRRSAAVMIAPDPFTPAGPGMAEAIAAMLLDRASYRPRTPELEADEDLKQVIPYAAVEDPDRGLFLTYARHGAEGRLADRLSLGLGGHLIPADGAQCESSGIVRGLLRELKEELCQDLPISTLQLLGLLNDDSDPVGRVHLGVAYHVKISGLQLPQGGPEGKDWKWASRADLRGWHQFAPGVVESWSMRLIESGLLC